METARILALDIGLKRTGVAISDDANRISLPLCQFEATQKDQWITQVKNLVLEWTPAQILVGVPLNQHGEEGKDAGVIRTFIALLQERVQLPVVEWDERFTTVQAEKSLITADISRKRRREVIDKIAASILLQSYLDSLHFSIDTCSDNENFHCTD